MHLYYYGLSRSVLTHCHASELPLDGKLCELYGCQLREKRTEVWDSVAVEC